MRVVCCICRLQAGAPAQADGVRVRLQRVSTAHPYHEADLHVQSEYMPACTRIPRAPHAHAHTDRQTHTHARAHARTRMHARTRTHACTHAYILCGAAKRGLTETRRRRHTLRTQSARRIRLHAPRRPGQWRTKGAGGCLELLTESEAQRQQVDERAVHNARVQEAAHAVDGRERLHAGTRPTGPARGTHTLAPRPRWAAIVIRADQWHRNRPSETRREGGRECHWCTSVETYFSCASLASRTVLNIGPRFGSAVSHRYEYSGFGLTE